MFNTKFFYDFKASMQSNEQDRSLLRAMTTARETVGAARVNLHIFDFDQRSPNQRNFLTYPTSWIGYYLRSEYADCDPLLCTDFRYKELWDWKDLDWSTKAARYHAELESHGQGNNGLLVSLHINDNRYGIVAFNFICDDKEWSAFKDGYERTCDERAKHVVQRYLDNFERPRWSDHPFSSREIECLRLVAIGQTDRQIAKQIGVSAWTVSDHLRNVRQKLGARNRAASVATAISAGLISI